MANMIMLNHFKPEEFRIGDKVVYDKMNSNFLLSLDKLREDVMLRCLKLGEPDIKFLVKSSYRTEEENNRVRGAKNSMHLIGRAVDIWVSPKGIMTGVQRAIIISCALNNGLSVGIMRNALHIDDREKQIVFTYPQAEFSSAALH